MYQKISLYGKPTMVNLEPDFWGYSHKMNSDPTQMFAYVNNNPDCTALPNSVTGVAQCLLQMARVYAPNAFVGFPPATWSDLVPTEVAYFQKLVAPLQADFTVMQTLDRDAGCFEIQSINADCVRVGSGWYWDETNQTTPNFNQHLAMVNYYYQGIHLPIVWWQTPLGVTSANPGGIQGQFRDNRVDYFTKNADQLVAVGGLAAVFSPGNPSQTTLMTDGGNFARLASAYQARPIKLPQGCSYRLDSTAATVPGRSGVGSVNVGLPTWCNWTASSSNPWITISSGTAFSGSANLIYAFGANTSASTRTGTIVIAGQTFTVTQSAANAQAVSGGGQLTGALGAVNVAVFTGPLSDYSTVVNTLNGTVVVTDKVANRDGISTLTNIQRAQFNDQNLAFDTSSSASAGGIYRIYAAAFNRIPDAPGLGYWIYQSDAGQNAIQIATGFTYSKEFQILYSATILDNYATGANLTQLVTGFYTNVLHRLPDPNGLAFYVNSLQTRAKTLGQVLAEIADSAENRNQVAAQIQNGIAFQPWHG
jgi:hypothetical protein